MSDNEQIERLTAMAAKARRLARGATDKMTIDRLEKFAAECDDEIERRSGFSAGDSDITVVGPGTGPGQRRSLRDATSDDE